MDPSIVVAAAVLLAVLVGAAVSLLLQRRTRRQLMTLMERIDQLERCASEPDAGASPRTIDPASGRDPSDGSTNDLSRDVLAGRTSFVRRAVEGELSRPASLAGQVIALVHSRIQDSLSPAELAVELSISLRTLERGLATELGCTPRQLILAMKMREARSLLMSGRFRVNEVATQLGFSTASHFSRCFRSFYRAPPSDLVRPQRP
jgi:AraC-like DNA-binding protein